jgi:hypothetical protein
MEKTPINYCKFIDSSYDDKCSVNEYNDNNSITEENTRTQKPPKYSCQPCDYKCNKKNEDAKSERKSALQGSTLKKKKK